MTEHEHYSAVLGEIAKRAPLYTPEWRFNPSYPDAGTAMAMLWADMFAGTLERFGQLSDNFKRALLDALGSEPRPSVAANGYLTFSVRGDAGDFIIPPGTVVSAPSDPDAALETCSELAASSAKITEIYFVLPSRDAVARYGILTDVELFRAPRSEEHVWMFFHDFAFNVSSSASLRIIPRMNDGGLEILAASPWEYLDVDDHWRELSVTRDGSSLLCVFSENKNRCNAVRVRVSRGAVLYDIVAKPSGTSLLPDALYADSDQEADGFYPFGHRFIPGICAYFACNDALAKPGAQIELSFNLNYENFEIEGYPEIHIRLKKLMKASDFEPPEKFEISAAEIKWEYFNGVGWAALGVESGTHVFNGKTVGRIKIAFYCPGDICSTVVGAHDLPFIRAKLIKADNLFRQRGFYKAPYISDIRFGYRYSSGLIITNVYVTEHLDSHEIKLPARLAAPPDGPAALYFAFDRAITRGTILFHIEPGTEVVTTRWEYLSDFGWKPLNVHDDTGGLSKTGVLSYQAPSPSVAARLWGFEAYWLRLVLDGIDSGGCLRGPCLLGLYENTVLAKARMPGKSSVLPSNSFTTITVPLAGVEAAANPLAAYGGADAEDEYSVITRLCASFSHSGRAVSAGDCEALALESSLSVLRARHYAHTNELGNEAYGESCLVILPHNAESFGFNKLREEILAYIMPRRAMGAGKLHIVQPRYIAVNISTNALIENYGEALAIKNRIEDTLERLCSPASWEIGQLPAPGRINTVLRAIPGILRLIKVEASYTMSAGISANYSRAIREPFILPVNGRHDISFTSL